MFKIFNSVEGYVHELWKGTTEKGYDVGLLKLDRIVPNITFPALDVHDTASLGSGDVLTALGWGRTESQQTADILQMAENLHYVSPAQCKEILRKVYKDSVICAGLLNEDTCKGGLTFPL